MHPAFILLIVVGTFLHFLASVPLSAPLTVWPKPLAWACWFAASVIWATGTT